MESVSEPQAGILGIGPWALGGSSLLPIDQERCERLREALDGVTTLLGFEDKFAMLIDNYIGFELCLLRISVLDTVRPMHIVDDSGSLKRDLNRHLSNFLASCRQYIDQNTNHIEGLLGGSDVSFKEKVRDEYGSSLSYRVMGQLRNYVQHRDLGVHTMTSGGKWTRNPPDLAVCFFATAMLDLARLKVDRDFKKSVLAELEVAGEDANLARMSREYVAALARIHKSVRKTLEPTVKEWASEIELVIEDFRRISENQRTPGLCVMVRHEDGRATRVLDVGTGALERLRAMERLNFCPTNLGVAFVSSEVERRSRS